MFNRFVPIQVLAMEATVTEAIPRRRATVSVPLLICGARQSAGGVRLELGCDVR